LGLAVQMSDKIRGYAGTPGYTAPEIIQNKKYGKMADFFSYGVMVYRFLSGKKPFAMKLDSKEREQGRKNRRSRGKSILDKNVVEMEPEYPSKYFSDISKDFLKKLMRKDPDTRLGTGGIEEIKRHPWFDPIDFGLLEAGFLEPPFAPNQDEVNAESLRHLGRNQHDDKYRKVRLTSDFQYQLRDFPFRSPIAIQDEIVELLQRADAGRNFKKSSKSIIDNDSLPSDSPRGFFFCCTVL